MSRNRSVVYTSSPLLASRTPVWRSKLIVAGIALGLVETTLANFDIGPLELGTSLANVLPLALVIALLAARSFKLRMSPRPGSA
jgi:hypothetical protein